MKEWLSHQLVAMTAGDQELARKWG